MRTINGTLDVRIDGNNVHIEVKVTDCDVPVRATAELGHDNVTSLRAILEEALIRLDFSEQNEGLGNGTLGQL
jgi:hypothetical protein